MSNLMGGKINVAITTTALINGYPVLVVYPNYEINEWNNENYKFKDEFVWKIGRMTSAAPWYFKSVDNSFDGGIIANNPTLDALVQVAKYNEVMGIDKEISKSVIVSVGTGSWLKENTDDRERLSPNASRNIFSIFFQAINLLKKSALNKEAHVLDRARAAIDKGSYIRLQPHFTNKIKLDETNTEKLLNMMWETKLYMYHNREKINEFMKILK